MFDIKMNEKKEILISGRFDASQVQKANCFFENISDSHVIDLKDLEYISSAGLGVLLGIQKRLSEQNSELTLVNLNQHIRDIFHWAGFDVIFKIQ